MDESDVSYSLDNEQQFWDELTDIVSAKCDSYSMIDNALRAYLAFITRFKDEYLPSEYDVARCTIKLLESELFLQNDEYVRRQIVYSLLQEDEPSTLHVIASFLFFDGRQHEVTFEMMNNEGAFPRLVDLVRQGTTLDLRLHRLLLELLYEMCRMQRLSTDSLQHVDDEFVVYLFNIIEGLSDDADDPYHYPIIRVLLVLNEQYMVAATAALTEQDQPVTPLTNRVIKILSVRGSSYMTFGENIILLLNRETETSLQLLILKLLYLLFTTKATHEYFYTNDLRVLLDVIIRNLLDLPDELTSLRHTYLRVLFPLLAFTQLRQPPHYKRDEILKVLKVLGGGSNAHFAPADETTLRLVERVHTVPWLADADGGEGKLARKLLGISLHPVQTESTISVSDVAAVMEKPGVLTPSRKEFNLPDKEIEALPPATSETQQNSDAPSPTGSDSGRRIPPPVPQPRRASHSPLPAVPEAQLNGARKLPPKAPPRRRTRLKAVAVPDGPHTQEEA